MNPQQDRFKIDEFKKSIKEIEKVGNHRLLRELEDKVIQEVVRLAQDGTEAAKTELKKLENVVNQELKSHSKQSILLSALKNSLSGALSVAKFNLF